MVLPSSHRIPRVLWYSGYSLLLQRFAYEAFTLFVLPFHAIRLRLPLLCVNPKPLLCEHKRFGLFPVRSPLLRKSMLFFLFLQVLRCFSSLRSPSYTMCSYTNTAFAVSSLIRISADQGSFAAPRSFSQLVTSFFGVWCQGILLMLFLA